MENTGKSALGLDANLTALLGYLIWPIALVVLIMEKENKFVRFHAIQSLLYHAVIVVLGIALAIVGIFLGILGIAGGQAGGAIGGILGALVSLVWLVVIVAYLAGLIYAAVQAYGNKFFKLPVVGNMAEKFANK
jgi:uncharacterized membrane protein